MSLGADDALDRVDVVILVARPVEEAAVVAAVGPGAVGRFRGRTLHIGRVGRQRVVVCPLDGMGNPGAAQAAQTAIAAWNPAHLVLTGIVGGIRGGPGGVRLGDVLVPDQVIGYEPAKLTAAGVAPRYEVYRPDPHLLAVARGIRGLGAVHFGPVLSGDKVLADERRLELLRRDWPQAIGVEMESLGVALAAYRGGPGFLVVKAVSDFADSAKNDDWQDRAAEAAARFAVAVIGRLDARDEPMRFAGTLKVRVCQRLHGDWEDLADYFDVPAHTKAGFRHGQQPRDVWEWLEARGRLAELPAALDRLGRGELADELRAHRP